MVPLLLDPTIVTSNPQESLFYGPIKSLPSSIPEAERERLTQAYQKAIARESNSSL